MKSRLLAFAFVIMGVGGGGLLVASCDDDGGASVGDGGLGDGKSSGGINGGGINGGGGIGAGADSGAGADGGTGLVSGGMSCAAGIAQCGDGMDNDNDGKVDMGDPECVSPCDNDEASFATGISGDNIDACKQDCFFDGDSGQGNDGCEWNLKCDPASPGSTAAKPCPYDKNFKNCPATQSDKCIKGCGSVTPNGCDCFGCCAFEHNNQTVTVTLVSTCGQDKLGDPVACPRCTQQTACINTCENCEVCIGKSQPGPGCASAPPPDGGTTNPPTDGGTTPTPPPEPACGAGLVSCGPGGDVADGACPTGYYCLTGCCIKPVL